ncbi:MAG: alpha/beta fold hydrolase [Candidatus Hodarchaeota archaeon]
MIEETEVDFKPHPLFGAWWLPDNEVMPEGVIVAIHGLGSHSTREFHYAGPYMAERKYAMFAIDLPGFGKWKGLKGNVKSWKMIRNAVQRAIDTAHERFPDLPLFLMGQSLGGLTILEYGLSVKEPRPVKLSGFIAYVPAIDYNVEITWYQKLGVALVGFLAGNVKYEQKELKETECHDPNSYAWSWKEDPLFVPYQRIGFILKLWFKMKFVTKNAKNWRDPLMVICADMDSAVKTETVKTWCDTVKEWADPANVPVEYHLFEETYHVISHELKRDEAFQISLDFIKKIQDK